MLRAFRFSAQLGFEIEADTLSAMKICAPLCQGLSAERIRDEVEKTLLSPHPERLTDMARFGLLELCRPDQERDCGGLAQLPAVREIRWAGLCRLWPELDLTVLRLDRRTAQDAMFVARCPVPDTKLGWKRLIAEQGRVRAELAAALAMETEQLEEIFASGDCVSLRELAVSGADFPELKGKIVGETLKRLLDHVLQHPEDNTRKKLLEIYKNSIDYCY